MNRFFYLAAIITLSANLCPAQNVLFKVNTTPYNTGLIRWDITADRNSTGFKSIEKIVYNLDGSKVANPVREASNRENDYHLATFGYDEGEVQAIVYLKDSTIQKIFISLKSALATTLKLMNTADRDGRFWKWKAFITGGENEVRLIDSVAYQLHPTFKDPYQVVRKAGDYDHAFELKAKGWGIFELKAEVYFKNKKSIRLSHVLQFNKIKVDVFYLESTKDVSQPIAEKIAKAIDEDRRFDVDTRLLKEITNNSPGYQLTSNQIRFNSLEQEYADNIISMISQNKINISIEKALISYNTPEYISIFIVK